MSRVLLDAETVIAAVKGRLPVVMRLAALKPDQVAVSVLSQVEVEAALRSQARVTTRHSKLLKQFWSAVSVLDFDERCAQQAVALGAYLHQAAEPLSAMDLCLAATALAHQRSLVSGRGVVFAQVPQLDLQHWN